MAREWKIHSWRISASAGPIASELEKTVLPKVAPAPEQTFLANTVRIEHEPSGWVLSFHAEDALKQSVDDKNEPVRVALANKWQADRADVLQDVRKMDYDWTYTTSYAGRWINKNHPESAMTMIKSDKQLNVELLTDRAIPLVAYHEAPLFVSELDDTGASELTVRVRVTDRYWFVLMRFYLRVDDTVVRIRDVRWYWDDSATSVIRETRWHETSDPGVVRASGSGDQAASLMMSMAPTGVVHYAMEESGVPMGI
mmetsp:Transcript_1255/g.4088  ORF Transcript_1255/g.4088 Transcript_1255/m.4088 type:complete len:255 (+) Transcript_1255:90-854(+)